MEKKKKILIVEDEPEIVEMLKIRLEANNYKVLAAFDGHEALEKVHHEMPDLVLLDIMLPKMGGYSVCRMIKFDRKYKHIPVVVFTARAQESDKRMGKEVGADAYFTKPVDAKLLLATIRELLKLAPPPLVPFE